MREEVKRFLIRMCFLFRFGQKKSAYRFDRRYAVFRHLAVQFIDQFLCCQIFDVVVVVPEVLFHIRLQLPEFVFIRQYGGVVLRYIFLGELEQSPEIYLFGQWGKTSFVYLGFIEL